MFTGIYRFKETLGREGLYLRSKGAERTNNLNRKCDSISAVSCAVGHEFYVC